MAGLHWLNPGENTVGGDSSQCSIAFDDAIREVAPPVLGSVAVTEDLSRAVLTLAPGQQVRVKDQVLTSDNEPLVLYEKGKPESQAPLVRFGADERLSFVVILRNQQLAMRVRDSKSPVLLGFHGLQHFPIDLKYRVKVIPPSLSFELSTKRRRLKLTIAPHVQARLELFPEPRAVQVPNALGYSEESQAFGRLAFDVDGQTHYLTPTGPLNDLSLIFGDLTNGKETYGAGRFLNVPALDPQGGDGQEVVLDFNQAYNPPCAFTAFATCGRPIKENRLAVRIEAGEQAPEGH